jgi:hypothetical protein
MTGRRIMASTDISRKLGSLCACVFFVAFSPAVCKRTAPAASALRYRVIVSEPVICEGQDLQLELELQNVADYKVAIDRLNLLYQVLITGEGAGKSSTGDNLGKLLPDEIVTLTPNDSYRKIVSYALKRDQLPSGLYQLQVTYGQFAHLSATYPELFEGLVESNTVLFEITACSAKTEG